MHINQELISLIDLTHLNNAEANGDFLSALCQKATTPYGKVAALCIYPRFVQQAAALLKGSGIKIATVANFPQGTATLDQVLEEIKQSIYDGAEEIDVVFPYQAYLNGQKNEAGAFVQACKKQCEKALLKVILETGALKDPAVIVEATQTVIHAGADFVKTSTGKLDPGATIEAATAILSTIKSQNRPVGFKAAGGIREPAQAQQYLQLAKKIMGTHWPSPATFRIGASQLLDALAVLKKR